MIKDDVITIGKHKDIKKLVEYFKDHLSLGDYYSEQSKVKGSWVGKLVSELVEDPAYVKEGEFEALACGLDPKSRKKLIQRIKETRRPAFDLVISPPKTFSIMALTLNDERLVQAHERAVSYLFPHIEKLACTRVRRGFSRSSRKNRETSNLIASLFTHETSRDLDPQLHTHNLIFNLTYDGKEKRYKAVEAGEIFENLHLLTGIYRNELAREVLSLGYELEQGKHTWRIKGVSPEVERLFSKRKEKIDRAVLALESEKGYKLDNKGRALIALRSRQDKDQNLNTDEIRTIQVNQLSEKEYSSLKSLKQKAILKQNQQTVKSKLAQIEQVGTPVQSAERKKAQEILEFAIGYELETKSIVNKSELLRTALKRSSGELTFEDIDLELNNQKFLRRGNEFTTREERKREIELVLFLKETQGSSTPLSECPHLPDTFSSEQTKAANLILRSSDQVISLRGAAGVGKTTVLKGILENVRLKKIITAPSATATDKLREDGLSGAITVEKLLKNEHLQNDMESGVLFIDEAGQLSTKQMEQIFQLIRSKKTKLILIGDVNQHGSVESGDALRLLERFSVIEKAEISTIRRQKPDQYRKAIQAFSVNNTLQGLKILESMGVFHQKKGKDRFSAVAQEYQEKLNESKSVLIVTPSWDEHTSVTNAVRSKLIETKVLGEGTTLLIHRSENFKKVEKAYNPSFKENHIVSFHKDSGPFKQGETWRVIKNDSYGITLENNGKKKIEFDPKRHSKNFDVVKEISAQFAVGDLILLKANFQDTKKNKISNGSIRKITEITKSGYIHLEDKTVLPPNFRNFTHGYATTSFGSQSKDADHVIISANSKYARTLSQNQMYVSSSRGKTGLSIYTDSLKKFKESVQVTSSRKLVLDALMKESVLKKTKSAEWWIDRSRRLIEHSYSKFRIKWRELLKKENRKQKFT